MTKWIQPGRKMIDHKEHVFMITAALASVGVEYTEGRRKPAAPFQLVLTAPPGRVFVESASDRYSIVGEAGQRRPSWPDMTAKLRRILARGLTPK